MKRQAYLLTIAFILLLTTCGAHLKGVVASIPDTTSAERVPASQAVLPSRTGSMLSIEKIISWFVHELLHTLTDSDDLDIAAHPSHHEGDQRRDRRGNSADRSADPDPYRLRARAQFRTPSLAGGPDDRR